MDIREELTLREREILCSQKGATWDLPFKHKIADRWGIPRFNDELTLEQIEYLNQNKLNDTKPGFVEKRLQLKNKEILKYSGLLNKAIMDFHNAGGSKDSAQLLLNDIFVEPTNNENVVESVNKNITEEIKRFNDLI